MPKTTDTQTFLNISAQGVIVDVRSPGEYTQGHIPGALNLPLFNDEQRAVVGTLYKKKGKDKAVLEGLRIVGPKMAGFVEALQSHNKDQPLGIHCWRGGQRSQSMAWLFEKAGFTNTTVLEGGYKSFRRFVLDSFKTPYKIRILGGYTGSGKTEVIDSLQKLNEQVVDLEGLAEHKGSAFGALGQKTQPKTEHFENLLFSAFSKLDINKTIWLEDESRHIGSCRLPDALFDQMRFAPVTFLDVPQEIRVKRLVRDYGKFDFEALKAPILRIQKRLGGQHVKVALEALNNGDLSEVARITLNYYDKAYRYGLTQRNPEQVTSVNAPYDNPKILAELSVKNA